MTDPMHARGLLRESKMVQGSNPRAPTVLGITLLNVKMDVPTVNMECCIERGCACPQRSWILC